MSGAGRGTPRSSPLAPEPPYVPGIPGGGSIIVVGADKWSFSAAIDGDPQVLTNTFAAYTEGTISFPAGSVKGLLRMTYAPGAAGSILEVSLRYPPDSPATVSDAGVFSFGGTPVFPAAGDPLGGELPVAVPVYKTQANDGSAYTFSLPFCIPAGAPTSVSLRVRETGTTGGTIDPIRIATDNYGC